MTSIALNLEAIALTEERFDQICRDNPDWKLETNAKGELIIMTPVGGLGGEKEANLIGLLWLWIWSDESISSCSLRFILLLRQIEKNKKTLDS